MLSWTVLIAAVLATMPVKLSIFLYTAPSLSFQCEISLYYFKIRFNGPIDWRLIAPFQTGESKLPLSRVISFIQALLRNAVSRQFAFNCVIGTGDACGTAIVVGGLCGLVRHIFRFGQARWSIQPDFKNAIFQASGYCILCFRGGDIMIAGMQAFGGQLPKMLKGWNQNGKAKH